MNMLQLQDQFAYELGSNMGVPWDRVKVHYEQMVVDGEDQQVFVANYFSNGQQEQFDLSPECLDILNALNKSQPANQPEKWTWFIFSMDSSGKYKFDFKYGVPPHIASMMKP